MHGRLDLAATGFQEALRARCVPLLVRFRPTTVRLRDNADILLTMVLVEYMHIADLN